ncbi:MAG: hypothetical protein DRN78_06070 [Thermoproteota archaeon]|nr:MAG: hypothetical protein DRN78_06070 [Candidatus Korarchaeota archaeon]
MREEEERIMALKPQVCPNCGYINPKEAEFCLKCGYPLTSSAIEKVKELEGSIDKLLESTLNDPRLKKALIEKLGELIKEKGIL